MPILKDFSLFTKSFSPSMLILLGFEVDKSSKILIKISNAAEYIESSIKKD